MGEGFHKLSQVTWLQRGKMPLENPFPPFLEDTYFTLEAEGAQSEVSVAHVQTCVEIGVAHQFSETDGSVHVPPNGGGGAHAPVTCLAQGVR